MACYTCDSEVATIIQILHNCVKNPHNRCFFFETIIHILKSHTHTYTIPIWRLRNAFFFFFCYRYFDFTFLLSYFDRYILYIYDMHTHDMMMTFVITLLDIFAEKQKEFQKTNKKTSLVLYSSNSDATFQIAITC